MLRAEANVSTQIGSRLTIRSLDLGLYCTAYVAQQGFARRCDN